MKELSLREFIKHIIQVAHQPELHMREIPVLVGLAILLIFIILVLIAIIFVRPSKKQQKTVEEKKLKASIRRRYVGLTVLGILTIVSIGFLTTYVSKPSFCAGCHEMRSSYNSALKTVHRDVGCLSCHQEPGSIGVFIERLELVEMVIAKTKVIGNVTSKQVSNEACLICHDDILKGVRTNRTLRIKHLEPVEAGYKCTNCHYLDKVLHTKTRNLDTFRMTECVDCHNQKKASADCGVCHTHNEKTTVSVNRDEYPKVNLPASATCKNCHLASSCLECHSLSLPHAQDWMAGGHSLQAFLYKRVCWQCHAQSDCKKCHTQGLPHADDWAKKHGPAAVNQSRTCSNCHNSDFCLKCHQDQVNYKLKDEVLKAMKSP